MIIYTSGKLYGVYRDRGLESLYVILREYLKGLNIRFKVLVNDDGWVDVELDGEDSSIACRIIERILGVRLVYDRDLDRFSVWVGRIKAVASGGLIIDVGVVEAMIAAEMVKLQLESDYEEAIAMYGLYPGVPVEIRLYKLMEGGCYAASFSDRFLSRLYEWGATGLSRVLITGATLSMVRRYLRRMGLERYVAYYERLGILEHHIVCKIASNPQRIIQVLKSLSSDIAVYLVKPKPIGYLSLLQTQDYTYGFSEPLPIGFI
ncbi:DUF2110 family protein [Candidatus Bathyarchaeota archaeon]|nr:DUF2110 family protein [Candidatus Bathyarchaeota archaeon]